MNIIVSYLSPTFIIDLNCSCMPILDKWSISSPEPMIDLSYKMGREKGKGVAGAEFVKALSEARQQGGGEVFMTALKKATSEIEGATKALLDEVIKKCEEEQ